MIKSIALHALLLCLLFPSGVALAQSGAPVVMYKQGKVTFTPDDGRRPYLVTSGDRLAKTGELMLEAGASVELNFREKHLQIKEAGNYQMAEVLQAPTESSSLIGRFFDFISNGLDQSQSKQSLEKAYLKNQGNAQGNTRGAGDGGLRNVRPFGGKLTAANYVFTWPAYPSAYPSANHYEFSILEERTGNFLITALASENTFSVNLGQLNMVDGQTYSWVCRAVTSGGETDGMGLLSRGAPKTELASITFTYTSTPFQQFFENIGGQLPGEEDSMLHTLSMAQALEEHGYLTDADYLYATLVDSSADPGLLKNLYASFLARWNLREEAGNLVSGRR